MIIVNGHEFSSLINPIYINGKRVTQVWVNGIMVYPKSGKIETNVYNAGDYLAHLTGYGYDRYYTKMHDGGAYYMVLSINGYIGPLLIAPTEKEAQYHVEDVLSPGYTSDRPAHPFIYNEETYYYCGDWWLIESWSTGDASQGSYPSIENAVRSILDRIVHY